MLSFGELKYGPVSEISGLDVSSPKFLHYCRNAVRQLMNRGGFWSNIAPVDCAVINGNTLVWPRGVATVLGVNVNGQSTQMQNHWYRFRQMEREHYGWGIGYQHGRWRGDLNRVFDELEFC
jgi:hypothetical protein